MTKHTSDAARKKTLHTPIHSQTQSGFNLRALPQKIFGSLPSQLPTALSIIAVSVLAYTQGYESSSFSVVALIFLAAVVYVALHKGVRQALVSSVIILFYNTASLIPVIQSFSFEDRNLRRIALLALVLPILAVVVGRLKERNDLLLDHEREARIEAQKSEKLLRFMAESMPQKVFTTMPDGTSDYFNPQWAEYSGMTSDEIKNNAWTGLIHPEDVDDNAARWMYSLQTGEPFAFEHRLRRHDGSYRWHISRAHAMRDDNRGVTLWIGSSTDIHDVKKSIEREHDLEKTAAALTVQRKQLIETNKAKDEFIALSSHQLRTPATGVKQYLGMVLEGFSDPLTPSQDLLLRKAYESNERQIAIINDLLKVARVDAGRVTLQKANTDLIPLIHGIIHEQSSKFLQRQQQVIFKPKHKKLLAMIDEKNIRMVIENIIDNASKYSPAGKNITVTLSKSKDTVSIAIKDEGVGVSFKDTTKLFHKFSRIDNPLSVQVGGSGLGLYWAKKIIDLHGGTIEIESKPQKGSVFTIKIHK